MKVNVDILFYAFRYALGRKTYAVSTVADCIKKNWDEIDENTKSVIIKEIKMAIENENAGMDCDKKKWNEILELWDK
jgi:hypothetical protein